MAITKPMRTVSYMLRFTPQEKARLERLAADQEVTLAHALREGAKLLLQDRSRLGSSELQGP